MEPLPTASRGFADRPSGAGSEPFTPASALPPFPKVRAASVSGTCHCVTGRGPLGVAVRRVPLAATGGFRWTWCPFARGVPPSLEALATTDREYAELPRGSLGRGMQQLRDRRGGGHRRRPPAAACSADVLAVYAPAIALRAALLWRLRHCPMIGTIGAAP